MPETRVIVITWACFAAMLCSTLAQGYKSTIPVDIDPKEQTAVKLGESLKILCRVPMGQQIRNCRVEIPGESSLLLSKGQSAEDGIEYYGDGLENGHCGVYISRVRESHDGVFKCNVVPKDSRAESSASLRIIVAKPPNNPELYTSPGSYNRHIYRNGEKLEISCSAPAGRPAANVSLYLDDELIGNEDRSPFYTNVIESSYAVQNASRSLIWSDNGRTLRCIANHIALDQPKETTLQLQVYYPPQPQPTIERFGYVIGRQGVINVTIWANPRPHFVWRVNNEKINEGRPDESNRLEASSATDMGRGAWSVVLTIDSVQKSDTEKEYILEARNDEGAYEYRIVLSTSSEPAGVDLDAGSIIGIVAGVLVLVLAVFLVIFARATGRWCFAGGLSSRNLGESDLADPAARVNLLRIRKSKTVDDTDLKRSDTESAGRYSRTEVDGSRRPRRPRINLSGIFKRNKDKVSGADTDTMRTVVTVDDEKLQAAEPAAEGPTKTNQGSTEGGIVYAELDLTQQQQGPPRRMNEDKTEYAEILYTKPEDAPPEQEPPKPEEQPPPKGPAETADK